MRTSGTASGDTAALVRQTLEAVAAALPVEDRDLPPETRDLPPVARDVLVIAEDETDGAGARRSTRWAALALAAAVLFVTVGVWATQLPGDDSTRTGGDDSHTLCGGRSGDPGLPGEEVGELTTGTIGVTGSDDVPYELQLWEDRVTSDGVERTGHCWRLTIGGRPAFRGGGDVATQGWPPVTTLTAVVWTDDETVFWAVHEPGVVFTADADMVSTPLDIRSPDRTAFTFLRVARDGRTEVTIEMRDTASTHLGTAGPLPLDNTGS